MKKLYFLCVFLSLFTLPFCLNAQNITWEKLNGPSGTTGQVYQGKDGFLILRAQNGRIYRSNNGGQSWEQMPPIPPGFSFVVGADQNLYVGDSDKIHRSSDNGLTWALLSDNIANYSVFALPDGELLVGTFNNQIKRSVDNGLTWQVVASNLQIGREFAYNPYTGDVYAWDDNTSTGETGKVWRSSDQGQTWQTILEDLALDPFQVAFSPNGAIFISAEEYIWRSLDNGATWATLDGFNSPFGIFITVTSTGRLFAHDWAATSIYSDDNGDTWYPLTDEAGNSFTFFSRNLEGRIFAQRVAGSVYVTEDDGANWQFAANNILNSSIREVGHLDAERILAFTRDGLFYSNDGGASWELTWDKIISENVYTTPDYMQPAAPDGSWYLWDGNEHIVRLTNEGQTHEFLQVPGLAGPGSFKGLWCSLVSPLVFCSTQTGFYSSANEGQTWTLQSAAFIPLSVIILPDGNLLTFDTEAVYRSTDNGQNWAIISDLGFWNARAYTGSNGLLYGTKFEPSVFVSPDGGLTWDSIGIDSEAPVLDLAVNNQGHIFLYDFTENIIRRSVDGGLTFNLIQGPGNVTYYYSGNAMSIDASQHLYLTLEGGGLYRSTEPTSSLKLLTGSVWSDVDLDCAYLQPDTLMSGRLVKLSGANETSYGYSNALGNYLAPVASGNYQISVVQPNDYWLSCNAAILVPNDNQTGIVESVDIGLRVLMLCPLATVSVSAPFLRRCFESTVYVRYENQGTLPAPDAYLTLTLDDLLEFNGASLPVAAQNGNTYTFLIGDLAVGASGVFTITVTPYCDAALGFTHCIEAHIFPDELCPEPNTPHIVTNATCLGDSVLFRIDNIGAMDMTSPLSWFVTYPNDATLPVFATVAEGMFLLDAGATFTTILESGFGGFDFYAQQVPEYPFNVLSKTAVRDCAASPGGDQLNVFSDDEEGPFTDILCLPNIGAFDPNDKQGSPAGLTENGYIERGQMLTYLIRFQNTGTDTAMNVSIRDTLPEALDPASVKLLNASHECELRMMPNGSLLFVFERIMLPDSNINEAASHGFVQFSVQQKPDIPTGMVIQNKAGIYFDFNAPVITNQTLHTVGIPVITNIKEPASQGRQTIVRAMPNPFTESFTITLLHAIPDQELRVLLMDNHGKMISEQAFNDRSVNIPRGNLPQGVYHFLVVNGNGKRIGNGTVVAQ
ncbi:MAG: hypothetical protein ACKV1O_25710 [Saprospiraceae bacterium]